MKQILQRFSRLKHSVWFVGLVLMLLPETGWGQGVIGSLGSTYNQNFDGLANSGTTNSSLPLGWLLSESGGTGANNSYAINDGSSNTGNTYSYGTTNSTDRAFGGLRSGSLIPIIGASFTNNSGAAITSFKISFTGEMWRLGTASRTDQLDFQYSINPTSLSSGTYIDVNELDFSTPNSGGTAGARDGNIRPIEQVLNILSQA